MNYLDHSHSIVSNVEAIGSGHGDKGEANFICIMLPYEDNPFFNGYEEKRSGRYNWYALTPEAAKELYILLKGMIKIP